MLTRIVICLLIATAASANAVEDFYSARIPVADRSEGALVTGAQRGLEQVLIRVSGDDRIGDIPNVAAAVQGARDRIALYSYEQDDAQTVLRVNFDDVLVKGILRESDATFWATPRPPVLLWLVIDEPFSRRFATVSQDDELLQSMSQAFADRGVTLRLPLLDLEDAAALSPEMVWQTVTSRIRRASERYGTEHILVGRYVQLTSGMQLADWLYLDADGQRREQVQGRDPTPVLLGGVDLAVDAMADRYAVALQSRPAAGAIAVSISGVESYSDYRNVMGMLRDIPILDSVTVTEVAQDVLVVKVTGISSAEALARTLPTRSRLAMTADPTPNRLTLHWGQP